MNKRHPNFKGGTILASNGYRLLYVGKSHHLADIRGYAYEHRLMAETKYGRRLIKGEQVHHIDGNRQNNTLENLVATASLAHHKVEHRKENSALRLPDEPNPIINCECGCGAKFQKFDNLNRPRRFAVGHARKGKKK